MSIIKNAVIEGGIEGIVVGAMQSLGKTVEQHGQDFIKSKIFGLGTNDEYLFQTACSHAIHELGVSIENIYRICKLINSYNATQRNRIMGIIGKNEEEVKVGSDDSKSSFKTNINGARIIAMFAKMTDDQIKEFLSASGATNTLATKLENFGKKVTDAVEKGEFVKDSESFFKRKSWLEKLADGEI